MKHTSHTNRNGEEAATAMKTIRRRTLAMLAVAGTLLCGLGTQANVLPQRAVAASPAKAYATARVTKIADGTGHGTAAQSFVNAKNGFRVGDNTKDDGVVSSGDTVEYRLELEFNAAAKRQIKVSWTKSGLLKVAKDQGSFCQAGSMVTATLNSDDSCTYTVPAGVAETISQNMFLTAGDTAGKVVTGQSVSYTMGRVGGETQASVKIGDLTIVSAPAADLVIDNGGLGDDGASVERTLPNWTNGGTASGWFDLKVKPLNYPGYNTSHGASTTVPWETDVDVSRFPAGTTWSMDGKALAVNNGRIHIPSGSGDRKLEYKLKYEASQANLSERTYDIRLVPDKTIFANTDDDGTTVLNLGSGGQPGNGTQRDQSTKDEKTGAIQGYPYKNNDWSRVKVVREDTKGFIFGRQEYQPYTEGTYFEPSALDFTNDGRKWADKAAKGARLEQHGLIYTQQITADCGQACRLGIGETWNPKYESYDGGLKVLDPSGNEVDPGKYWIEWNSNYLFDSNKRETSIFATTSGWTRGTPPANAGSFRIHFLDNTIPLGSASGAGTYQIVYYTRVTADASGGNITSFHATEGDFTGEQYVDGYRSVSTHATIIAPGKTAAENTIGLAVTDDSGQAVSTGNVNPGDHATYTIHPKVRNIQITNTQITPTVTVALSSKLADLTCDEYSDWTMNAGSDGKTLTFTLKTGTNTAYVQGMGDYDQLPDIQFTGRVGNLTGGTVNATARTRIRGAASGPVNAWDVTSPAATAPFQVSTQQISSGRSRALKPKSEIGDTLQWEWNIIDRRQVSVGTITTVLHMPTLDDSGMTGTNNTGLDGTWGDYTLGHSQYNGAWRLDSEPALNMDDSTTTTLAYSTTVKTSDNPADYTWKAWRQLTDAEKGKITAIRVQSKPIDSAGMKLAASKGTITLTPTGNKVNDRYNLWIGSNRNAKGERLNTIPFPGRITIVKSSIAGTVWWDLNRDADKGADENGIEGITIKLWKTGQDGDRQGSSPYRTVKTGADGSYLFDDLHSGTYKVEVTRQEGTKTDTGVQTKVKTYYNQDGGIENTVSWNRKYYSQATDLGDQLALDVDIAKTRVDFGYYKTDPKAVLDKTQTSLDCANAGDGKCTISWDVKVDNAGKTSFPTTSTLTDRMKENVKDVTVTAGTTSMREARHARILKAFEARRGTYFTDAEGYLYLAGTTEGGFKPQYASAFDRHVSKVDWDVKVKKVTADSYSTIALDSDGHLWRWTSSSNPTRYETNETFKDVVTASGRYNKYTVAVGQNGQLWTFTDAGELTKLQEGTRFTSVTSTKGVCTFAALDEAGHIWTWGDTNGGNQLGDGTRDSRDKPVMIAKNRTFVQVAGGDTHFVALDTNGHLWSWGVSSYGTIKVDPNNTTPMMITGAPTPMMIRRNQTFVQVSAGDHTTYALTKEGVLYAWGGNNYGQLGDGTTNNRTVDNPTVVKIEGRIISFKAAGLHAWAWDEEGHLWGWGFNSNDYSVLGDGTKVNQKTPVEIAAPLADTGIHVDPTAVPVSPTSETTASGYVIRTYNLPFEIAPGGSVVFHFTGVVEQASKDQTVVNQAWFDSPSTPYSGTPNARAAGVSVPSKPDYTKLDTTSHDVTGNASCRTGSDYRTADMEHWFSTSAEDSCDQVGAIIPGNLVISPARGTISGLYWEDTNRDGIRQTSEMKRLSGQKVYLYNQDGDQVGMTTTGTDGTYRFDNLTIGSNKYTVQFSRVDRRDFTKSDANDSTPATDGSFTDSDAGTAEATYGQSTVTVTLTAANPNKSNVDAGVLPERAWLASMPHTGMGTVLPLLLLCGLASIVTAILLLRRPRTDTPDTPDEVEHSGE
ncbi:SdrD B-like domain-containing protein [Bifidobacterium sp.]|uniref:SdrD B-like domain-containing protein n=1 Tax=Bifidobacterium sp. TaxID=41200 RepID=UPI0040278D8C